MGALKLESPDRVDRNDELPNNGALLSRHWGFAVAIETSIPGVVTPGKLLSSLSGLSKAGCLSVKFFRSGGEFW
jgi:hypothetical protein